MKLTKEELKEFEKVFWNIEFRDEDLQFDLFDKNKLDHLEGVRVKVSPEP